MNELIFLPDRDGRDEIGSAEGFVRIGAEASDLKELAARLAVPAGSAPETVDALAWRSALTLALLTDVWADCGASLIALAVNEDTSPFASWVLAARPEAERGTPLTLLLLEREGKKCLLGVADARCGLRLPATSTPVTMAPPRAAWIDEKTGTISDPVPFLTERDREILLRRMDALHMTAPEAAAFAEALRRADGPETEAVRCQDEAALEKLALRLEAVCGLKGFECFSVRSDRYEAGGNALLRCLTGEDGSASSNAGESQTYLWRGVPFARTSKALGLTEVYHPGAEAALEEIRGEVTRMSSGSVKWNYTTGKALQAWLDDHGDALLPEAKARIEASCALLKENGRQVQSAVMLTWPWNASSGAIRALLMEALGEDWMEAAEAPFSDRLTRVSRQILGDRVLQTCCAAEDGVWLPPLSRAMAACVAKSGLAAGLALDAMRFQLREDGSVTASFLLRGEGEVCMVRTYTPEEICVLTEGEAPCVAVWPCLPMADWKAYYVFVQGDGEVAAPCKAGWQVMPPAPLEETDDLTDADPAPRPWRSLRTDVYPGCISLQRDGLCLGALPNMLPAFRTESQGDMVVGIDMGSSQTAVAFAVGGAPRLMEGQALTRMLLQPSNMPEDPLLSSLTPMSVTPTAAVLTGEGENLFEDGYALRPESMQQLASMDATGLRARLKWRSDKATLRARKILMHQVMLGAALTAVTSGAQSLAWRLTIADDMGDEGREDMLNMMQELAHTVETESGLKLADPAVTWAEESAALCTCLRAEGTGRGSCMAVDLGSASTKIHLWVQSQSKPSVGAVVLEGVQDVLLRAYHRQPMRLLDDLADCGDEALLQDVLALMEQLNPDLMTSRQPDRLSLMLDLLLDRRRVAIGQHLHARNAANRPTFLQAVLLEMEAAILFAAGLMLAQAGDDSRLSHLLPEDMTVCLTGRGAWLLETLTPQARSALQHLTRQTMRLDHPVRFVTIRPAAHQVQSVALGLTVTRETGRTADAPLLRTRESFSALMQRLMQQLCAAFPLHMWVLHEGIYDWQTGALTPAGEDSIRRAASRCYGDGEDIAASVMAFVRTLREAPILPDSMTDTGA